jgi:predicted transcriptional regulator
MSSDGTVADRFDLVARRSDYLELLADRPRSKRELRDALGVSRSTEYKARRELRAAGLVRCEGDEVALTQFGRLARRQYDWFLGGFERLVDARPMLSALPDDRRLPLALFARGRQVGVVRTDPERPLAAFEDLAEAADRLRCLAPVALPRYLPRIRERVDADDLALELVLESGAAERLSREADFAPALRTGRFSALRTDRYVPFGLLLVDGGETVALIAYRDRGAVAGLVASRDPSARAWAEATYERYREASTALEAPRPG